MSFNFTSSPNRTSTPSLKWQRYAKDVLPMWVADMDLCSPPAVIEALTKASQEGIFGYGKVPAELNSAFINWCKTEYDWQVEEDWLVWLPGVVPGFNLAVEAWLQKASGLLVQTPVYPPIKSLANLRGLTSQEASVETSFTQLAANWPEDTAALVLCNPQNPLGKVYSREELLELNQLAEEKNLLVISDDIWADLILQPGLKHTPYASLNESAAMHSITLMAASKTFNIAGLSCAVAVIPNKQLRKKFLLAKRGLMPDMNYLGLIAATAAWQEGKPWLTALKAHLNSNLDSLENWLASLAAKGLPSFGYQRPAATFVAWLNAEALGLANPAASFLEAGVALTCGSAYGSPQYVRLNFACPASQLEEALARMEACLTNL